MYKVIYFPPRSDLMHDVQHITHVSAVIGMASRTGVTVVMKKAQQQHGESKQGPQKLADSGSPILYLIILDIESAARLVISTLLENRCTK